MTSKAGEILVDAFGVVRPVATEALKCDRHLLEQYDYVLNKETGVFEVVETGKVDITEIINSNKENCGLNLALLNIARGMSPEAFKDDGKHGGDFSKGTNLNEAYQDKLVADQVAFQLAKILGLDNLSDSQNVDEIIKAAVAAKFQNQQAVNDKEGESK